MPDYFFRSQQPHQPVARKVRRAPAPAQVRAQAPAPAPAPKPVAFIPSSVIVNNSVIPHSVPSNIKRYNLI